jgi:toxin FitB
LSASPTTGISGARDRTSKSSCGPVRRDPAQAQHFGHWLSQLIDGYGDRIVPITIQIAEVWGRLNDPDPVPVVDGLMAATALVHDWTLVTRNVHDAGSTGTRLLNPFTDD